MPIHRPCSSTISMPLPNAPMIRLGDLNGDGFADLAVGTTDAGNAVKVLFANPDGSFRAPVSFSQPGLGSSLTLVDFDWTAGRKSPG